MLPLLGDSLSEIWDWLRDKSFPLAEKWQVDKIIKPSLNVDSERSIARQIFLIKHLPIMLANLHQDFHLTVFHNTFHSFSFSPFTCRSNNRMRITWKCVVELLYFWNILLTSSPTKGLIFIYFREVSEEFTSNFPILE